MRTFVVENVYFLAVHAPGDEPGTPAPVNGLVRRIKQGVAERYRIQLKAKTRKAWKSAGCPLPARIRPDQDPPSSPRSGISLLTPYVPVFYCSRRLIHEARGRSGRANH
jgi:hypothetical protein